MELSFWNFLLLLLIASIAGGIGQMMVGYSAGGCLASVVVGLVGGYLGTWIATELSLPMILSITISGIPFPLVWAIVGSALFAAILGLLNKAIR